MTREERMEQLLSTGKFDFLKTLPNEKVWELIFALEYLREPCEDAVSRQAVIKLLSYDWANRPAHKAVESVRNLPSVTPKEKTGWIPVSERLPEESKRYVVATKYNDVMTDFYTGEGFLGDDIIAWMPLPEPYKAESVAQE